MSPLTVRENTRTSPLTVVDPDFDQCMQINRYDVIANYRCNDAVCKIFDLLLYLTQYSIWTKQKSIPWWSVWLCIISKSNKIFFANIDLDVVIFIFLGYLLYFMHFYSAVWYVIYNSFVSIDDEVNSLKLFSHILKNPFLECKFHPHLPLASARTSNITADLDQTPVPISVTWPRPVTST